MIKGKKKNWKLYLGLLLMLGMAAFLNGCAAKEPSAEQTPKETSQPQTIQLTVNNHMPPVTTPAKALNEWGKWLEEQSNGRLKVTIHHGGALLKGNEAYRGVQSGVADLAYYVVDRQDGFFLNTVTSLPFLEIPPREQGSKLIMELLDKLPEMQKEWKGVKPLDFFNFAPSHLNTAKKVVKNPDGLKGMRLFSAETMMADVVKVAGGAVVEMGIEDLYLSLDRGLVEGFINHFGTLQAFGALEKLPYHTIFSDNGVTSFGFMFIMNENKFNSLPSDLQKLVQDSVKVWSDWIYKNDDAEINGAIKKAEELKHTFTHLSKEEIKVWQDTTKPIHDKWISEGEAQGLPAKAVYEEALRLVQEYQK